MVEVTKDTVSLHVSLQKQMLARNILCSLLLKLNFMDAELYDLPFWVMQPFQDMGPLGLEGAERGCEGCLWGGYFSSKKYQNRQVPSSV